MSSVEGNSDPGSVTLVHCVVKTGANGLVLVNAGRLAAT